MKYIRTKSGKILKWGKHGYLECKDFSSVFGFFTDYDDFYLEETKKVLKKRNEEILNIADTIEELCDEVFTFLKNGDYSHFKIYDKMKIMLQNEYDEYLDEEDIVEVKLAILTDKGLIFVAKMNEKGELELL